MRTLVIIPAYNEESNIKKTIEKLKEYHQNFDYIVINELFHRSYQKDL